MSRSRYGVKIELEQEIDGRWIAEVLELPGVITYGAAPAEAIASAQALALRVIAGRLEHGEAVPEPFSMSFEEVAYTVGRACELKKR